MQSRIFPVLLATGVGIATGVYVFQPLLKEYEAETNGTWILPGNEQTTKPFENKPRVPEQKESTEKD
ncbi:hypothetical protein J3Q64DRAFT_1830235 [Phycomyces blakesleeanus]|uniref:Uncharacterized protein n=2 Tax=Phycomyces blakesleeanus TaxID=4837 RepID=A0A167P0R8_PHYB8|nr:hypothetical protein PHYBLDRAFT_142539 [Phycomyces blakesleeanus NRRL 1555(-)]OAD77024.1 hypothetical protein PHYBLDRAFT_142539 [Phycomyces blakesleeanus NRRL 1555(-)]|eukprot:XP_018295064.1 hypothetical protein PHYBLDRAFT_142539 [Phycomyces blakesleeanus NRRL 1555(-)]